MILLVIAKFIIATGFLYYTTYSRCMKSGCIQKQMVITIGAQKFVLSYIQNTVDWIYDYKVQVKRSGIRQYTNVSRPIKGHIAYDTVMTGPSVLSHGSGGSTPGILLL